MRKDFEKVLTERPRVGGKYAQQQRYDAKNINYANEDAAPVKRLSTARHRQFGYDAKDFADLINPLYRFLQKQVGRKWDVVWSEVCGILRADTVQGRHLRQHVEWAVERNAKIIDGRPYHPNGTPVTSWRGNRTLYVDGKGYLRAAPTRERYRSKREPFCVQKNGKYYKEIDGQWYELLMKQTKNTPKACGMYDTNCTGCWPDIFSVGILHRSKKTELKFRYGTDEVFCYKKRQISYSEKKRLGV